MSLQAVLLSKTMVAPGLFRLILRMPQGWTFQPGQFVILPVPQRPEDAKPPKGFYSICSGTPGLPEVELLVEHREGGPGRAEASGGGGGYVSAWVTGQQPGAELAFEGPLGHFGSVNPGSEGQVFLCHRAGLAPLRSMLLSSLSAGQEHWLFLGGEAAWPLHEEWRALAAREPRFHYQPVADAGSSAVLAAAALKALPGRRGLRLYLAGSTRDVVPNAEALIAGGFAPEAMKVEKFG